MILQLLIHEEGKKLLEKIYLKSKHIISIKKHTFLPQDIQFYMLF